MLVPATEAIDEPAKEIEKAIQKNKDKNTKKENKPKKLLIIEDSDEED